MSDSPKTGIDELITAWLVEHTDLTTARSGYSYWKIPPKATEFRRRMEALLDTLVNAGHSPDDIRGTQTTGKIIRAINPTPERIKRWAPKYRNNWKEIAENQVDWWKNLCLDKFGAPHSKEVAELKEIKTVTVPDRDPVSTIDVSTFKGYETNAEWDESFVNSLIKDDKDGK